MLYRVTYEIDVDASSPINAARQVHGYMQDSDSFAPILSVMDESGVKTEIDLEKDEN